jgi:hypothetical protein
MTLEIQVLARNKPKNVEELNRLIETHITEIRNAIEETPTEIGTENSWRRLLTLSC